MIVCPNCNHQNPDGAVQCEACYTPLPATMGCPNCGATVQTDASFCGQCGFNLRVEAASGVVPGSAPAREPSIGTPMSKPLMSEPASPASNIPDLVPLDPLVPPEPLIEAPPPPLPALPTPLPPPPVSAVSEPVASEPVASEPVVEQSPASAESKTQLQQQMARLLHVQTSTLLELPQTVSVIHLGKPNDRIPPDIDLSGFPDSEIVSRIHADIRIEGDTFYIEDVGSSNGTYINNVPLSMGNRHRLRSGDRIALGKGDKVTFLFQLS